MLDFAIFAVTFVLFLILLVFYLYPGSNKQTTIPGLDPSDAKEGNIQDVIQAGSLHQFLSELHSDHGPIASFWMGQRLVVSLAAPDLFEQYLQVFDKPVELFGLYQPIVGEGSLLFANGKEGRKRRQAWETFLNLENYKLLSPVLVTFVTELAEKWASLPDDQHIPLHQYTSALCMKTCSNIAFGDHFEDNKNVLEFNRNFEICWTELEARVGGSIPDPKSPQTQRLSEAVAALHQQIKRCIGKSKGRVGDGLVFPTFLEIMAKENVPEAHVLDDAVTFAVKHCSVACAMTWALYFLGTHSEVQEKLYKELKTVLGDKSFAFEDMPKLKYLKQVIDETLRTAVVEPWTARYQDLNVEIGGHVVPQQTPVIQAIGVVMQSEKFWAANKTFDPDRFDTDNAKGRPKLSFQPFGFAGKRGCPGSDLAYLETTVLLAHLCQRFKVRLVDGQVVSAQYRTCSRPEDEVWITVTKR